MTKALAAGADVVVVDLEDAVAPDREEYAREATAELLLEAQPVPVHVPRQRPGRPLGRRRPHRLAGLRGCPGCGCPR
ncbi:aldolase/citrate lyase family protein [Streptomyces tricolor]|nr:aldolase/citrate lyase family protein [Streptomyces tricolor]